MFNVIGTTYGTGDGSTTFNLPDLRDRFPVGAGDTYDAGDTGGEAEVTLTSNQMPSHNHTPDTNANFVTVDKGRNLGMTAKRSYTATNSSGFSYVGSDGGSAGIGEREVTGSAGGGQPHENMPPYIGLNFLIYGGVLLNSIFKVIGHLQKIGGGLNDRHKGSACKDSQLELCNRGGGKRPVDISKMVGRDCRGLGRKLQRGVPSCRGVGKPGEIQGYKRIYSDRDILRNSARTNNISNKPMVGGLWNCLFRHAVEFEIMHGGSFGASGLS